jgi:hypothetical protein
MSAVCTGAGDGDAPHERRDPLDHLPGSDKYPLWIEHEGAKHAVFEGDSRAHASTRPSMVVTPSIGRIGESCRLGPAATRDTSHA